MEITRDASSLGQSEALKPVKLSLPRPKFLGYLPTPFTQADLKGLTLKSPPENYQVVTELANEALMNGFKPSQNDRWLRDHLWAKMPPESCSDVQTLLAVRGIQTTKCEIKDDKHWHSLAWKADNQHLCPRPSAPGYGYYGLDEALTDRQENFKHQCNGELSPCKIIFADGTERHFLKHVLVNASPRLAAALEKGDTIRLPDAKLTVYVERWLDYLMGIFEGEKILNYYSSLCEINPFDKLLSGTTIQDQIELTRFALQYEFHFLAELCISKIWYNENIWGKVDGYGMKLGWPASAISISPQQVIQLAILADDLERMNIPTRVHKYSESTRLILRPRIEHFLRMHPNFDSLVKYELNEMKPEVSESLVRLYRIALEYKPPEIADAILDPLMEGITRDTFLILVRLALNYSDPRALSAPHKRLGEALRGFMQLKGSDGIVNSDWFEQQAASVALSPLGTEDQRTNKELHPHIAAWQHWKTLNANLDKVISLDMLLQNPATLKKTPFTSKLLELYSPVRNNPSSVLLSKEIVDKVIANIRCDTFAMIAKFALECRDARVKLPLANALKRFMFTPDENGQLRSGWFYDQKQLAKQQKAIHDPVIVAWKLWKRVLLELGKVEVPQENDIEVSQLPARIQSEEVVLRQPENTQSHQDWDEY